MLKVFSFLALSTLNWVVSEREKANWRGKGYCNCVQGLDTEFSEG